MPDGQMAAAALHPELINIAEGLTPEQHLEIASTVIRDYQADEDSRKDYLAQLAEWRNIFNQIDKPINPPFEAGQYSQESLPVMAEACVQFHARAYRALFGPRSFIKAIPTGEADKAATNRADRIGKHMSWQLTVKDKKYKKKKDALLLAVSRDGTFFTKTYYDPIRKCNENENVRAEDLVVNYGIGARDIEDVERKTHIIWMSVNKTRILKARGFFLEEGRPWQQDDTTTTQKANEEREGLKPSIQRDDLPCKILEQHRTLDLDGDGIEEPYIVWIDTASRKLLRIGIRWEIDAMGNPLDEYGQISNEKWPVEYFTDYYFMPNPDGFYGLGYGHLVGQINKSVNKLLRQVTDASTLATVGNSSGFISGAIGAQKGGVTLELGKFKTLEASSEDIQRSIYQFKFPGPNAAQFSILEMLKQDGQRLASTTEALTGQTDTVQQPTTILALIEQGLQVFSTVYERISMSVEAELRKNYRLNSKFLDEKEYFTVLDYEGPQRYYVDKNDYKADMQVMPVADPKQATEQQKLAKGQAQWQFLSTNPLVMMNPMALTMASRDYAECIGVENIDRFFPLPKGAQRVDDPMLENMGALLPIPQIPNVFIGQNHLEHIKVHEALFKDPHYGQRLTPEGAASMYAHIQLHMAMMYGATESTMLDVMDDGQIRETGMAAAAPNAALLGGAGGPLQGPQQGMEGGGLMGGAQPPQGEGGSSGLDQGMAQ